MQVQTDLIHNRIPYGDVATRVVNSNGDVGVMRPWLDDRGRSVITLNRGGKLVNQFAQNAATLRKDEWVQFDQQVLLAARRRLRAWADLRAANTYGGFNGFNTMVLEHETMSDPGEANVDFDGITEGRADAPVFQLEGLPLPITHASFHFSSRRLAISRALGNPLDSVMAEAAGRRVAESIEKTLIGVTAGPVINPKNVSEYGTVPKVYGYTNFPQRVTKTDMTLPTDVGWTPKLLVFEILDLIESLADQGFYGPFMCYHSPSWNPYLDQDYSDEKGDNTVRERIGKIDQISNLPRRLDYLTGYTILLVQMTPDVARAVNGMEMTTVQWETMGGFRINFKVLAIQVGQLRSDFYGNCGIGHGTAT